MVQEHRLRRIMKEAQISVCGCYRYALWRLWNRDVPYVMFVGLNPSAADAEADDPTLRRCIGYARSWGYGGVCIGNLFAYRATDPDELLRVLDPIGPENDKWLERLAKGAGITVAAWGNRGRYMNRDRRAMLMLVDLHCLGINKQGQPKHPLYLRKDLKPLPWRRPTPHQTKGS